MRFFVVSNKASNTALTRHRLYADVEIDLAAVVEPPMNAAIENAIYIPAAEIGGFDAELVAGLTRAAFYDAHKPIILRHRLSVIARDLAAKSWALDFNLRTVREIRRHQLKTNFHGYISALFPEWKQLNMQRDLDHGLEALARQLKKPQPQIRKTIREALKTAPGAPPNEILRVYSRARTGAVAALDELLAAAPGHTKKVSAAVAGFQAIDALRDLCREREAMLDATRALAEAVSFDPTNAHVPLLVSDIYL